MAYITTVERIGLEKGYEQDWVAGKTEGKAEGALEGKHQGELILFLRLLERKFGEVSKPHRELMARANSEVLLLWCERVLSAENIAEVFMD